MKVQLNPVAKLIVVIEDKEYPVTAPTLGAVAEFEEKLDEATAAKKGTLKVMMNFIVSCGLPEEATKRLDMSQLQALMAALTPAKKN